MRNEAGVNNNELPERVREILRAQPLNPFVKIELRALRASCSMIGQDWGKKSAEAAILESV